MKSWRVLMCSSGLLLALHCDAIASACRRENVAVIKFARGSYCWFYEGNATTFRGHFRAGQSVTVRMWDRSEDGRSPNVAGPNGFFETAMDKAELQFVTGMPGLYSFSFAPCVLWHHYGRVEICAY